MMCPNCRCIVPSNAQSCEYCGYIFENHYSEYNTYEYYSGDYNSRSNYRDGYTDYTVNDYSYNVPAGNTGGFELDNNSLLLIVAVMNSALLLLLLAVLLLLF